MRRLFNRVFRNAVGDNPWYLCVEIFFAAVYGSALSFTGAYAIRLGATNSEVSLLSSITALTAAIILLPAGHFLQSRQRRKGWLLSGLMLGRAGMLLYILLPWMHVGDIPPGRLFVILFAALTFPTHFFNLGFIPFLAQAIPEPHRADTFAARNILAGAMTTACNFLFGAWLGWAAFPANYQVMFFVGFIFSLLSLYYLGKVHVVEAAPAATPSVAAVSWRSALQQWLSFVAASWKVREFTLIVVNTFLHGVGVWASTPLLLLYFVRTLGATEAWLGVLGSVSSLATIVGYLVWKQFIARWGEPLALKWTIVTIGVYPLLAGAIPSLTIIPFIAGFNGLMAAGVNLSHFNTSLRVIPEAERHNYTALYLTLMNVGAFISPLAGIYLAERIGFAPVLMACGLLSVIGSTSFWIWPVGESRPVTTEMMPQGGQS